MSPSNSTSWFEICYKCGRAVLSGVKNCTHCGAPIISINVQKNIMSSRITKKNIRNIPNNVLLYNLDGFEFEKLVGEIYSSLGYSVVDVKKVGDEGRDLIIEKNGIRTLIECKHQKGTVGRPVIQKLHSAVIVDKRAENGIVVTTGHFSQQAINYTKKYNVAINLIDLVELRRLAEKINIRLLLKGEKMQNGFYPVEPDNITHKNVMNFIEKKIISYPETPERLFYIDKIDVQLIPVYRVSYKIKHETNNTSGRLLYSVNESNILHIRADNLNILDNFSEYFSNSNIVNNPNEPRLLNVKQPSFLYDDKRTIKSVKNYLIKKYSKIIQYYGDNNVRYEKECILKKDEIFMYRITPVYLPFQKFFLNCINSRYFFELVEKTGAPPFILKENFNVCSMCKNKVNDEILLCNSCGASTHKPHWWRRSSHSYICDLCGKTICRECGYWKSKWLVMKKVLCFDCVNTKNDKIKYQKIPALL